jgi:lambda family phage portal protein
MKKQKKLAARLYDAIFPPKTSGRHKREYAAAKRTRLNADWTMWPRSSNWELRQSVPQLRARARQMCHDDAYFRKFLRMCRTNVIGPKGLQLMVRAYLPDGKTLNAELNKRVQDAWWEWGFKENCSVTGKLNWLAAQRLFITHLIRDGETLVQKVASGPFGFALKFWNVDYLDEQWNAIHSNGNRIIMSVEIDDTDRPVAYWLRTPPSDVQFSVKHQMTRIRVPAEQMIHAFLVNEDESQVRGVTAYAAVLLPGKNLHVFEGAVLDSAKMTAMSGGIFTKKDDDETEFKGVTDEETGRERDIEMDMQPASFLIGPDGYDFNQFDPKQPQQNFVEFDKQIISKIAAGLDVPYFSLAGDMKAVNYSSARVGQADERDVYRELQDFVGDMLCREVYHDFLPAAVLSGKLKLSPKEFQQVQNPKWQPRGWDYVNPKDEIDADVLALQNNLSTLTDTLAERGIDIREHFETIQQERELAKEYDIELVYTSKTTVTDTGGNPDADVETTPAEEPAAAAPAKRALTNGHNFEHIEQ